MKKMSTYRVTVARPRNKKKDGPDGPIYIKKTLAITADSPREAAKKANDWAKHNINGRSWIYANAIMKLPPIF